MSIQFKEVGYTYSKGTPFEYVALNNVNLDSTMGKITAIIGATGSGKTTLVQHLNALLLPTEGQITICDRTIDSKEKPKNLKSLRKEVGLVFQFPEYQLFEETIAKDIAFGPKNFGATEEEGYLKAREALKMVKLDESYLQRSPLDCSGGQKRRVAIAGILAMSPSILVLDEPTAGLDPKGAKEMMDLFKQFNTVENKTILLVTHDLQHVLNYCDEVVVMEKGSVCYKGNVNDFFKNDELMKKLNILPPAIIRCKELLKTKGFVLSDDILDLESLAKACSKQVVKR